MAKKVQAMVKLQIPAGKATPAPPVGTALGPHGVNIMDFCKNFNAKTASQAGLIIPAVVTINTMDDLPAGRQLVRDGNGLAFILLRVTEGKPLNNGRLMNPAVGRNRFRMHLLGKP